MPSSVCLTLESSFELFKSKKKSLAQYCVSGKSFFFFFFFLTAFVTKGNPEPVN